jgi:hypothetical protein
MPEIRLAFSDEVGFADLARFAAERDWAAETAAEHPVPGDSPLEEDSYVFVWRLGGTGTARFVDDEVTEVRYLVLQGEDAQASATALAEEFPTVTHQQCLDVLAGDPPDEERTKALETLGVIAPRQYDDAVAEAVRAGLDGHSPLIRSAAVSAAVQLSWAEFRGPVQRVAERDPDPNNRAYATNALYSLP